MILKKLFKFRIFPTKKQARLLQSQLNECRWLYNQLLEQRKLAYEELDLSLTKYQQLMFLPELKIDRPSLGIVHSQVLQNIADRLDRCFRAFFRRCRSGEKPGFPRFRGVDRYHSFCYPQSGFKIIGNELKLAKIGSIRIKSHREITGKIKTCTICKDTSENWNVLIACEYESKPLVQNELAVGIDVGIEHFATLTDGTLIDNPRFFKKEEKALAKAQKKLSKTEKGTKERAKKKKIVAKIHQRIKSRRNNFCHQESRKTVDKYQFICLEDLNIQRMVRNSKLAKSIMDVSWNQFYQFLSYKAVEAGRKLGLVNPAYTSQTCSQCKHIESKKLSSRVHICSQCGYKASRDFNASKNILALGLDGLGEIPRNHRF
jgi:putative transposase